LFIRIIGSWGLVTENEQRGRRPVYLYGGAACSFTMLVIGILYASAGNDAAALSVTAQRTVIAMIYLFVIAFSVSWGVVVKIYIGEIQPTNTRAGACALGQSINWVGHIDANQQNTPMENLTDGEIHFRW